MRDAGPYPMVGGVHARIGLRRRPEDRAEEFWRSAQRELCNEDKSSPERTHHDALWHNRASLQRSQHLPVVFFRLSQQITTFGTQQSQVLTIIARHSPRACARKNSGPLSQSENRKIRPDGQRDIARRQMGVVPLGHAGVGMAKLGRNDAHRHPVHGEMRTVSVAKDVEIHRGRDLGLTLASPSGRFWCEAPHAFPSFRRNTRLAALRFAVQPSRRPWPRRSARHAEPCPC